MSAPNEMTPRQLETACREYVRLHFQGRLPDEEITFTLQWNDNENAAWCELASQLLGRKVVPNESGAPNTYSFPRWVYPCRTMQNLHRQMQAIQTALMS